VALAHQRPALVDRDLQDPVGELAEVVGDPLHAVQPLEVLHQQPEHLRVMGLARDVHPPLDVRLAIERGGGQRLAHPLLPGGIVGDLEQLAVEQLVEQDRMPGQVVGRPFGRPSSGRPDCAWGYWASSAM
jgi:hypothetical protein